MSRQDLKAFISEYYDQYGFFAFDDLKKILVFPSDSKDSDRLDFALKPRSSDTEYWVLLRPAEFGSSTSYIGEYFFFGAPPLLKTSSGSVYVSIFDSRFRLLLKREYGLDLESYEWFQRWDETDEPYSGKISERIWAQGMDRFTSDFASVLGWNP